MTKIYSMDYLKQKLKTETNPAKVQQLKMLLDEMSEVYPDESELIENPKDIFTSPDKWKSSQIKKKLVLCIQGESFTGKTFQALTASHLTQKHIENDYKNLDEDKRDFFKKKLDEYIPFTPLWVIGTEESTHECLTSSDNYNYFKHADINYVEVLQRGSGLTLIDQMKTYKNFLIALYSLSNEKRGTIVLDSMSSILSAQHEIIRRIVGKLPSLKKEQGIMPKHWFWRNVEQEGIMFFGRISPMNFIFTIKVIKQAKEGDEDIMKVRWHEETNLHLSSVLMRNERIGKEANFRTTIMKCRPNKNLYNKVYRNLTVPALMYNIFTTKEQKKQPIKTK